MTLEELIEPSVKVVAPFPPVDDEFCESHIGPTPSGGVYSTAYFYDAAAIPVVRRMPSRWTSLSLHAMVCAWMKYTESSATRSSSRQTTQECFAVRKSEFEFRTIVENSIMLSAKSSKALVEPYFVTATKKSRFKPRYRGRSSLVLHPTAFTKLCPRLLFTFRRRMWC